MCGGRVEAGKVERIVCYLGILFFQNSIMEHTKMQRLLKMLLLLSGNRHYSVTELAERFDTA